MYTFKAKGYDLEVAEFLQKNNENLVTVITDKDLKDLITDEEYNVSVLEEDGSGYVFSTADYTPISVEKNAIGTVIIYRQKPSVSDIEVIMGRLDYIEIMADIGEV